MSPADRELIESAAALLDTHALDIRHAHNIDFLAPTWEGEAAAKRYHDLAKATADGLYALLDRSAQPAAVAPAPTSGT